MFCLKYKRDGSWINYTTGESKTFYPRHVTVYMWRRTA